MKYKNVKQEKNQSKIDFSKLKLEDCKQLFQEEFEKLTQSSSFAEVWADFAEIGAICAHQTAYFNPAMIPSGMEDHPDIIKARDSLMPIDDDWQSLENRYMTFVPKYEKEGMNLMSRLYAYTHYAVTTFRVDFLGSLQQEFDLSGSAQKNKRGEFFTPTHVAEMIAQISLKDAKDIIERKGFITVSEPCCGAGGMVIAFANTLKELGYNPQEILYVDATDVNKTFFNLAYLQLSMLDIPARIRCGDTLLLTQDEFRDTPQLKVSRYHWENRLEFQLLKLLRDLDTKV